MGSECRNFVFRYYPVSRSKEQPHEAWVIIKMFKDEDCKYDYGLVNYISCGKWGDENWASSGYHGGAGGACRDAVLKWICFSYRGGEGRPRKLKLTMLDKGPHYQAYHTLPDGRKVLWAQLDRNEEAELCEDWLQRMNNLAWPECTFDRSVDDRHPARSACRIRCSRTLVFEYYHVYRELRHVAWVIVKMFEDEHCENDYGLVNYISRGKWGDKDVACSRYHGSAGGVCRDPVLEWICFSYRGAEGTPRMLKLIMFDKGSHYQAYHTLPDGSAVLWARLERIQGAELSKEWLEGMNNLPHTHEQTLLEHSSTQARSAPMP